MVVLDTTLLIDQSRGDAEAQTVLAEIVATKVPVRLPAAVWIEYLHRLVPAKRAKAQTALEAWVRFEPVTREIADAAARLQHDLDRAGSPLGWHDLQIAATALHYGEPVVTRDTGFGHVPGLAVKSY